MARRKSSVAKNQLDMIFTEIRQERSRQNGELVDVLYRAVTRQDLTGIIDVSDFRNSFGSIHNFRKSLVKLAALAVAGIQLIDHGIAITEGARLWLDTAHRGKTLGS